MILGQDRAVEQFARAWASLKLHHAWLLAGPKGVGKASFARAAARRVLADAAAIIFISILMGSLYHVTVYGELGRFGSFLGVGATAAGLFVLPGLLRGEYELGHYL